MRDQHRRGEDRNAGNREHPGASHRVGVWHGAAESGKKVGPMHRPSPALPRALTLGLLLGAVLCARTASAASQAVAPAGGGLPSLTVRVDLASRSVDAGGTAVAISLDPAQMPGEGDVVTEVVAIGKDRRVVHVRVPAKDVEGLAWEAVLAGGRSAPIFAGLTGPVGGDPGERTGKAVQIRASGPTSFVLVGDVREDLGICGQRVTLLDPQALYPASLELRPATVQRLSPEEQARATEVAATEKGAQPDAPLARLLVARGSSVPDSRGAELTDGDPATTWAEQRPGVGQGEFVVMAAPKEVPIARMQIAVTPTEPPGAGASPKTLYLVTSTQVFRVALPTDAWAKPGRSFEVAFPQPVEASCVALVLDTAYARGLPHPEVSVSELVAYSEFDGPGATLDDVASKLSGPRGEAAAQVLERAGAGALGAVTKAYDRLDVRGRALAMDVASSHERCEEAVQLLARGLCETDGQAPRKAHEKLGRCRGAAPALAEQLRDDAGRRACIAPVLAELAPDVALAPIADALGRTAEADRATREALRAAFARALKAASAGRLGAILGDAHLPPAGKLEVLRAAGPHVLEAPAESEATVTELLQGSPPMRTRYLVLEPLGELARGGDKAAAGRIADSVARDADWPVRAKAAELAAKLAEVQAPLAVAAGDPEPRVREAALGSLAQAPSPEGVRAAGVALGTDHWSFVRAQAVAVLAAAPASPTVDSALGGALEDASPRVRGGAVLAIGRRRATSWQAKVRDRLDDKGEDADVRAEAAWALGAMCDAGSLDRLTDLARALSVPTETEGARQLGLAALIALAAMKPGDLGARLAPLLAKSAPPDVRHAAEKALAAHGTCQ